LPQKVEPTRKFRLDPSFMRTKLSVTGEVSSLVTQL
jgi:hypothetical protein